MSKKPYPYPRSASPLWYPIENVWAMLSAAVYADKRQYTKVEELKKAIQKAWDDLPMINLQKLDNGMPDRCVEVI
ncbi:hypothetical protein AAVH_17166 [Aphelenchoides avenae]|nr:hypothetical protein AAVH_17166 [Aphelenchus avenae]